MIDLSNQPVVAIPTKWKVYIIYYLNIYIYTYIYTYIYIHIYIYIYMYLCIYICLYCVKNKYIYIYLSTGRNWAAQRKREIDGYPKCGTAPLGLKC